ncbi:AI-2E family transporter [Acetatifactor aquisgranensis]|uniref:AI-2E family transporter n=1 Tax=Acetatifactor aquisgranensis TaxID=2941233 RepID=UPI00203C38DA|nr:AI-2E family transporter [Acetatifactor aquisgranensis]
MNQDRDYWKLGITIFASLSATVCFFFLIFRFGEIRAALGIIRSALQPLFVGIALAYVLCPVEKRLERLLGRAKGLGRFARPISVLLTMIAALAILVLFCALVVPQLVDSISGLVRDLPKLLETQLEKLNRYLKSDNDAAAAVMQMIESSENSLLAWIRTNLLATVSTVATSILSMGSALINTVVSVVVTIYLLLGREHYLAQCRKLFLSVSRNERFNRAVFEALTQTNRIFNGFISGKLLDSLIVGIICFVCLSLLRMPYALLISVIVGMTNIIPMFGPFIGAVPSAFLLLLVSPMKCLIFLVFIIILQQVDGNIIGPRILGNSTGLSALYVTVAMLLFGKLMGFFGMIVGVPLFATLYYIVKRLAEYSLRKQGLPADTKEYVHRKNTELVQEGAAGEGRKE